MLRAAVLAALLHAAVPARGADAGLGCHKSLRQRLSSPASLRAAFVGDPKYTSDKFSGVGFANVTHRYEHLYQPYLQRLALQRCAEGPAKLRVLEIGLGCGMEANNARVGGSIHVWRTLFPPPLELQLVVMEYNASCAAHFQRTHAATLSGVTILTGDQSSSRDLDAVYRQAGSEPFDIVIDDGSHVPEHQLKTLEHMVRARHVLSPGGLFFVEDMYGSCTHAGWQVMGDRSRWVSGGSSDCMGSRQKPTMFARVVEWQRALISGSGSSPFTHVDVHENAVAFELG